MRSMIRLCTTVVRESMENYVLVVSDLGAWELRTRGYIRKEIRVDLPARYNTYMWDGELRMGLVN